MMKKMLIALAAATVIALLYSGSGLFSTKAAARPTAWVMPAADTALELVNEPPGNDYPREPVHEIQNLEEEGIPKGNESPIAEGPASVLGIIRVEGNLRNEVPLEVVLALLHDLPETRESFTIIASLVEDSRNDFVDEYSWNISELPAGLYSVEYGEYLCIQEFLVPGPNSLDARFSEATDFRVDFIDARSGAEAEPEFVFWVSTNETYRDGLAELGLSAFRSSTRKPGAHLEIRDIVGSYLSVMSFSQEYGTHWKEFLVEKGGSGVMTMSPILRIDLVIEDEHGQPKKMLSPKWAKGIILKAGGRTMRPSSVGMRSRRLYAIFEQVVAQHSIWEIESDGTLEIVRVSSGPIGPGMTIDVSARLK